MTMTFETPKEVDLNDIFKGITIENARVTVDGRLEIITAGSKISMFAKRILSETNESYEEASDYLVIELEDSKEFKGRLVVESKSWKDYKVVMSDEE